VARFSLSKVLVNGHDKMQKKERKTSYKSGTGSANAKAVKTRGKAQKTGLISLLGRSRR
jgi:hypothetical protein